MLNKFQFSTQYDKEKTYAQVRALFKPRANTNPLGKSHVPTKCWRTWRYAHLAYHERKVLWFTIKSYRKVSGKRILRH